MNKNQILQIWYEVCSKIEHMSVFFLGWQDSRWFGGDAVGAINARPRTHRHASRRLWIGWAYRIQEEV